MNGDLKVVTEAGPTRLTNDKLEGLPRQAGGRQE